MEDPRGGKGRRAGCSGRKEARREEVEREVEETEDHVAFTIPKRSAEDEDSDEGEDEEGALNLEHCTTLVRNPPVKSYPRRGQVQLQLAMLVNDRPCPCYYISPAAVEAHQLPARPGWYIEVPDEDVAFTVRTRVKLPEGMSFPVATDVLVDGICAEKFEVSSSKPRIAKGFHCGIKEGMRLVQPFRLGRALHESNDEQDSDDRASDEDNSPAGNKNNVATICLQVLEAVDASSAPSHCSPRAPHYPPSSRSRINQRPLDKFIRQAVPQDKKSSFGIERSTDVGPVTPSSRHYPSECIVGELLWELQVFYRTRKFFETLQCRIDPRGAKRSADAAAAEVEAVVDLNAESEDSDDGERTLKKRIKREVASVRPPVTPLQNDASIDAFLTRFAAKEEMEMEFLKPVLIELSKRKCYTMTDLQKLRYEDWEGVMRTCKLPISLARSAMRLCSAPLSADSVIILD